MTDKSFLESLFWLLFAWDMLLTTGLISVAAILVDRVAKPKALAPSQTPCGHCPVLAHQMDAVRDIHQIITQTATQKPPK